MYAKCLGPDIEYKTVNVPEIISSRELVLLLLSKYRDTTPGHFLNGKSLVITAKQEQRVEQRLDRLV